MSAISLKSITGITSITTPTGVDNQLTLHNNNTTEAVKLDTAGNLHFHNHLNITGISTAANFKTGTSNLHNTGLNVQDLDVDGHTNLDNVSVAGVSTFTGLLTANGEILMTGAGTILELRAYGGPSIGFKDTNGNTFAFVSQTGGTFRVATSGNSYTPKLVINPAGLVGIATDAPSSAFLDIASSQATDSLRLRRLNSDANIASNWSLKPYGGNLYFREGGSTDKIVFTDDPKVSIGGHTPGSILDMRASGQVDVLIGSTNAGGAYLVLDGDSNGDGAGADYSYIAHDTGGDLLIGADNPSGDADIVFKIGDNTEKLRLKASTGQMLLTSGMLLNIGGTQGHCPLHVTTENTTYGKSAIFGASGWVNSANYHYTDATITLLGRDADNNDKGAGVEFTARNTANSNWLHGAVTFGQDGGLRLFNGGAGNSVGTERFRIASDGVTHLNSPDSASGGRLWANSSALYLQSGNGRQTFKVSDAAAGQNRTIEMTTDGHIKFPAGYGIEFSGGTPNAGSNPTVNSAVFDDYEEGKFEPKFLENGTTESNYAWRYGSYVKVGGIVHIRLAFGLNSFNSSGGNFTTGWIGGMPYTHASPWGNSDFAYIQLIGYSYASGYGDSGNTTQLSLELSQNADKFRVVNGQSKGNINQSSIGTGQRIAVTFSYPVA